MSVLIKGMEMPENCYECRFQSELRLYCNAMPDNFCGNTDDIERPDWCPLTEVPTPHGRLIDADKLKSRLVLDNDSNELQRISADILKWIDIQETVIEGSET